MERLLGLSDAGPQHAEMPACFDRVRSAEAGCACVSFGSLDSTGSQATQGSSTRVAKGAMGFHTLP